MHRGYWLGAPSALSTDPIHVRAEKSTVCSQTFPKILPVYAFLLQIEAVEEFDSGSYIYSPACRLWLSLPLSSIYMKPDVGDVLLWESWLRHEVPMNMSEDDRISVSFNYRWE